MSLLSVSTRPQINPATVWKELKVEMTKSLMNQTIKHRYTRRTVSLRRVVVLHPSAKANEQNRSYFSKTYLVLSTYLASLMNRYFLPLAKSNEQNRSYFSKTYLFSFIDEKTFSIVGESKRVQQVLFL